MKKFICLILCLFVTFSTLAMVSFAANTETVVSENFEEAALGNWETVGGELADGNKIEVKAEENGNKYLHYTLANSDAGAQFAFWSFDPIDGVVTISMDIIRYDANSESRPHLLNSFRGDILPFEYLKAENGQTVVDAITGVELVNPYTLNVWTNYILVFDTEADTEKIYVDGELVATISGTFTDFMQLRFHQRNLAAGTTAQLGIDNLQIIKGDASQDIIDANKPEENPPSDENDDKPNQSPATFDTAITMAAVAIVSGAAVILGKKKH